MTPIGKDGLSAAIADKLSAHFGKKTQDAAKTEIFCACAILLREMMARGRVKRTRSDARHIHYLSMEFLMGRSLAKNAFNLGIYDELCAALRELGLEPADIFETEPDAGLGNGGLGRLAACYLDSMATLGLPATGYSLCYELGMFCQKIVDYRQTEVADSWTVSADSWLVPAYDEAVEVRFGGVCEETWGFDGKCHTSVENYTPVLAVPRDMLISGYETDSVNILRLWDAKAPKSLDMRLFSGGEYVKSMEQRTMAEVITKVLYPADDTTAGKILRIKQQYFFVSATAQSVVRQHRRDFGDVRSFAKRHVFQINDTHPTMIIPELMRIFMDEDGLGWDEALNIASNCVAYTNHTVMAEALESWPQDLIETQLPRIWQIIREIDIRHRKYLEEKFYGNDEAILRNLVISGGSIHMANICLAVCFRINGVSAMHSEILKRDLFKDIYALTPERFTNVTNGIDHRRWLTLVNPGLHRLIAELLGSETYLRHPERIALLENFAGDDAVLRHLEEIKRENKLRFCEYVQRENGLALDPDAVFDVQVKRLHEYKRQLLCAMLIIDLQQRLHANPNMDFLPRSFVFGAKAASSYKVAKRIISLLCSLADEVNADPLCRGRLQVVFLENYRVSVAERLMPAAQVSEQISTAGKEASGTGNMKLMMNGAITIGTLDGANVEMHKLLGDENMMLFGLRAEEIAALKKQGYDPLSVYNGSDRLRAVLNKISLGFRNGESFSDLVSKLVYGGDSFMLLADFDSYLSAHDRLYAIMSDKDKRSAVSLRNIARSGVFAADRAVSEYAKNIWGI
ncbi:MAG: glycogen/starch/alpha-glucan family phosphorylase [Oscillospiraceae bacterium]|jgi:starch phosphorylase|nr:glycogen/starch/alpha-glucan family phosphorylase [Oscillospiraceae bacterium]